MFPKIASRRKPGWLCILPQSGRVTLVHAVWGEKPEIRLLDNFAAENGPVGALQRLQKARKLSSFACTTLIAPADCTLTQLEAPAVPKEERKEALRWALKDVVPYPVDSACIDVLDLPGEGLPPGRALGVLVVSAAEQAVRECAAPFEAAQVRLDAIDIPELAQRNAAALLEDENRGLVLLRIDESGMMLTLSFHGELLAVRRSDMNAGQLAGQDAGQRERVMERLMLELQRSLDNFDRQYSHVPVSKVVVACHPPVDGIVEALTQGTYVPLAEMDLNGALDFSGAPELKDPAVQAKYLLAIGAALRTGEPA